MPRIAALSLCAVVGLAQSAASADVVTEWNQIALNAIVTGSTPPPASSRALAMTQAAVFDAINSIDGSYQFYRHRSSEPTTGALREAAAVSAAHRVLVGLYPAQAGTLNTLRDNALAALPLGGRAAGEAVGIDVANQVLAWRATDGSTSSSSYTPDPGLTPGRWQRTAPPGPGNPLLPQWGAVEPFAMNGGAQFRPPAPPSLGSPEYAAAYNEVKSLGGATSVLRTPEQSDIARAWAFGPGTITPPGAWNRIAQQTLPAGMSLVDRARAYAMLNVSMADAAIACWEAKYLYDLWRPITAVQRAAEDGNVGTEPDAGWISFIFTPNFPAYTSGHSTFSRAGATILAQVLGTDNINIMFEGDSGVLRMFTSLDAAADEAGLSRIYGGIHFNFDDVFGQQCGLSIANWVIQNQFLVPSPGTGLALVGLLAIARRRR